MIKERNEVFEEMKQIDKTKKPSMFGLNSDCKPTAKDIDLFEKHFSMLDKNQKIFEKYKTINSIGIEISEKRKKEYVKIGKELLPIEKSEQFREVRSIHYNNVVMKKLEEYTLPEWIVCLKEEVLLEYTIPVFSRVLHEYPMLCGMNREWQVLYDITNVNRVFWQEHKEWKAYFDKIIDKVILECKRDAMKVSIPEEYLCQFKNFKDVT